MSSMMTRLALNPTEKNGIEWNEMQEKKASTHRFTQTKFDGKKLNPSIELYWTRMKTRLQCVYIDELDFGRLKITFVDFDF